MDLVASPSRVIVTMEHKNKKGVSKFVKHCDLPLTGKHVVDTLITEMVCFYLLIFRATLLLRKEVRCSEKLQRGLVSKI